MNFKYILPIILMAGLIGVTPAPTTVTSPAPLTYEQLQTQNTQYAQAYDQLYKQAQQINAEFNVFVNTTYGSFCITHKGLADKGYAPFGAADKNGIKPAFPVALTCKDGHVVIIKSLLEKPL